MDKKESSVESELNPKFIKKLNGIKKEKGIRFVSINELRAYLEKSA